MPNLLNSYISALGQHYSLELRFQRDTKLEMFISTVIRYKFRKKFRKDIELVRIEAHLRERLMFAILFSTKFIEAWQSKTNSASSYKEVCLIERILAESDLLNGLTGTIFRFVERPIALTAEFDSIFLQ